MKQKLLISTSGFPLYENDGESQFMLEYAKSLGSDFDVFVLAPKTKDSKVHEIWDGINVFRHKQSPIFNIQLAYKSGIMGNIKRNPLLVLMVPIFILMQIAATYKLVKKLNIDLINAHWIFPQGLSTGMMKLFGFKIPYILTVHSGTFWHFGKFPYKILRDFSLKKASAVTCVSKALQRAVLHVKKNNVFHLPLGINLKLFDPNYKNHQLVKELELENKKVITFVGTMVDTKGVNQLIRALPDIVSTFPESILLMIGEGKNLNQLKQYTHSNNLQSHVIFTGKIEHSKIPDFLSVSHLLCIPSLMEGFPMVVKEAMASEVLVLASKLPVFKSEPELEKVIFYVPKVEERLLSEKIIEIITNIDGFNERKKMGRKFIEDNANWKDLAQQFKVISENL